jgi:TolA-binding protein
MKRFWTLTIISALLMFGNLYAFGWKDKLGVGFNFGGQKLLGDKNSGNFVFGGSPFVLRYNKSQRLFWQGELVYSRLSTNIAGVDLGTSLVELAFKGGWRFFYDKQYNPIAYIGLGVFNYEFLAGSRFWDGYGLMGGGVEYFLGDKLGINLTSDYRMTSGKGFDGAGTNDSFFTLSFGFNYYLGGRPKRSALPDDVSFYSYVEEEALMEEVIVEEKGRQGKVEYIESASHMMQNIAGLTAEKSELLDALEEKEAMAQILRTKVESLEHYHDMLSDKASLTGVKVSRTKTVEDPVLLEFNNGLAFYQAKHYDNAIETFSTLLREHSHHHSSGDWWYWLGESYFAALDFGAAAKAFEWSLVSPISGSKTEMARLMLGISKWKSGDSDGAISVLERLAKSSLSTDYEKLAQQCLTQIRSSRQ